MNYSDMSIEELNEYVNKKDALAMCELGQRYRYGKRGADQNYTLAYRMYHKAEKLKNVNRWID